MGNVTENLKRLDLNLLISLNILLDENNVTKASHRLNLSQSAVSTQLSRLRVLFDDPLLVPATSGRGMVPTSKAKVLQAPLKRLLRDIDDLVSQAQVFNPSADCRVFNVAIADYPLTIISKTLIQSLHNSIGENIQIAFHSDIKQANELMKKGELDLVIASNRGIPLDAKAVKLLDETFVMAQRKNHPRGGEALLLEEYCSLKHILVSTSGGSFFGAVDERLEQLEKSRQVALSVTQFNMAHELIKNSDYVCTLPSRLIEYYSEELDGFTLPFDVQGFSLYLGWHPAYDNDPAVNWLKCKVIECFR